MVVKKLNKLESVQKIYASRVDVKCMHTNFDGMALLVSEILLLSNTAKFPFLTMAMVVKKLNQLESAQKIYASRG